MCVDRLEDVTEVLGTLSAGSVTFLSQSSATPSQGLATQLQSHVRGPNSLNSLLNGVYAVEGLNDALAMRSRLNAGESVITRDGVWIGRDWLRVSRDQAAHALTPNIPGARHVHWEQPRVGHYGIFNGRKWREQIMPRIRDFIRAARGYDMPRWKPRP